LTFRVLEEPSQEPDKVKGEDKLPYTNPPPGEEVFKQPKLPKNVFYEGGKIIDVSPYEYHREWREEMAAQLSQPPDEVKPAIE
jgi:hypothetical protein